MITQEIKLYDEPKPAYQAQQTYSHKTEHHSIAEITRAILDGQNARIRIGDKYKYKHSGLVVNILGMETDPSKVNSYGGNPAIYRGQRRASYNNSMVEFMYTVEELLDMEKVYE